MVVPEAVDDDPGEEIASPVLGIGDPVGEGASPERLGRILGRLLLPVGFGFSVHIPSKDRVYSKL